VFSISLLHNMSRFGGLFLLFILVLIPPCKAAHDSNRQTASLRPFFSRKSSAFWTDKFPYPARESICRFWIHTILHAVFNIQLVEFGALQIILRVICDNTKLFDKRSYQILAGFHPFPLHLGCQRTRRKLQIPLAEAHSAP